MPLGIPAARAWRTAGERLLRRLSANSGQIFGVKQEVKQGVVVGGGQKVQWRARSWHNGWRVWRRKKKVTHSLVFWVGWQEGSFLSSCLSLPFACQESRPNMNKVLASFLFAIFEEFLHKTWGRPRQQSSFFSHLPRHLSGRL